ncbi:MAG: Tc toxin subunit A, partial [Nevskiales bacterium]
VAMTALASQFGQKSRIDPEFYYALFRAGVPANEAVLSQMAPERVQQAWERAIERKILPAELKKKIPQSLKRFKAHSAARLLKEPSQIGVSNFQELLQGALPDAARVERYLRKNDIALDDPVLAQVKKLQRVYQIGPSDEAMSKLLEHHLDSAYAVVRYDEQAFVSTFKDELGGEAVARLTYAKAHQVHHAVLNITTSYLLEKSAPRLYAIDNLPARNGTQTAIMALTAEDSGVLAYPTLEGIFGEMDFCACEHCRSWLSPAAYLVDLLQFLDPPPLEVLLGRRPDIQHLQLTCENTNTVLPYIDLVNEILEYYVVNGSLATFTGHNIEEDVSTEELLANPQFVNDAAYIELRNKVFPPPLPFHQPLEAVRRYFEHFEIPLHQAMERLRANDNLERADGVTDPAYGWRDILMERLRLSRPEHAVLTDSSTPLQTLYGEDLGAVTDAQQLIDRLSNARAFARRLNLSYEELIEIIRTQFTFQLHKFWG